MQLYLGHSSCSCVEYFHLVASTIKVQLSILGVSSVDGLSNPTINVIQSSKTLVSYPAFASFIRNLYHIYIT
jgi:hypothetical protein